MGKSKIKKQLEEYKRLDFKHLNDKCNKLENQQKEFIEYLEDYIKDRNKARKLYETYSESENRLSSQYFILQEILSKYKEIIEK